MIRKKQATGGARLRIVLWERGFDPDLIRLAHQKGLPAFHFSVALCKNRAHQLGHGEGMPMTVLHLTVAALMMAILLACGGAGQRAVQADLVLVNGRVWTVDASHPEAQAVAVWKGRILAVGSDEEIRGLAGESTQVIGLGGKLVLPGLNDSHTHFVGGGFFLLGVDLKNAASEEEFGRLLAEKSKALPAGAWITGGNWDHDRWPGGNLPTAGLIDQYVPDRPVFVSRYDGHLSVANSVALKLAGVSAATPDPPGGEIVRKTGSREPAGVLREHAAGLVGRIVPDPGREETRLAIETALKQARERGITSIQQVDLEPAHLDIYQELLDEGKLTCRIYGLIPLSDRQRLAGLGIRRNFRNRDWIAVGGVKAFLDGSLGSSTAMFHEPYAQDPSTRGMYVIDPEVLKQRILEADKAGLQVAVHSIGDRANSDLLDMYAAVIRENGPRDRRFRIEHAQHMARKDFERFAGLGVIASVQPYHAIDDGRFAAKRIGAERCKMTYPFKTFLDNGVIMAAGSDWTVAPLDALAGIYAAVTRRTLDGKNPEGWIPEQKITVEQAVKAYTLTSAYASFQEDIKGSITPGKLADMVVLSQDIFHSAPEAIEKTEVLYTIVDGRIVYRNRGLTTPGK